MKIIHEIYKLFLIIFHKNNVTLRRKASPKTKTAKKSRSTKTTP